MEGESEFAAAFRTHIGKTYRVEYDGFIGTAIGFYLTREGKSGTVLQQVGTKVVHVYGTKRLEEIANAD